MKFARSEPEQSYCDPKSLNWVESLLVGSRSRVNGLNQSMFREDFRNILRLSSVRDGTPFLLDSNDNDTAVSLLCGFETQYGSRSIEQKLAELLSEIVQNLLWFGKAYYFLHNDRDQKAINIRPCSGQNMFEVAGFVFQYLPRRVDSNWNEEQSALPRELRLLDSRRTLRFSWPATVRRKISLQGRVLAALDKFDHSVMMRFQPKATHENPYPRNDFDFIKWRDSQEIALYRATREIGWNGRKYDSQKRSDFFDCHRLIRFRRNQLQVRDHVLKQLGNELTRVAQKYKKGFKLNISATGELPSILHLDELDARLTREEVGFTEVIDYCFKL